MIVPADSYPVSEQIRSLLSDLAIKMATLSSSQKSMIDGFLEELKNVPLLQTSTLDCDPSFSVSESFQQASDTELSRRVVSMSLNGCLQWKTPTRIPTAGNKIGICNFHQYFQFQKYMAGLMYLDPFQSYPEHRHSPKELYLLLSGKGHWRYGGATEYRLLGPDNLLYNPSSVLHGVANKSSEPNLSFFLLEIDEAEWSYCGRHRQKPPAFSSFHTLGDQFLHYPYCIDSSYQMNRLVRHNLSVNYPCHEET